MKIKFGALFADSASHYWDETEHVDLPAEIYADDECVGLVYLYRKEGRAHRYVAFLDGDSLHGDWDDEEHVKAGEHPDRAEARLRERVRQELLERREWAAPVAVILHPDNG